MPDLTREWTNVVGDKRRTKHGWKWTAGVYTRYFSGSFDFPTFSEALDYLQYQRSKYTAADERNTHMRGWIDGPGGRLDWNTIKGLPGLSPASGA